VAQRRHGQSFDLEDERLDQGGRCEYRPATSPIVWRVDSVGDTNGDWQSDFIWRNTSNGSTVVWRMDGFIIDAAQSIGALALVWEVQ
jgi:hypothetical protein